MSCLKVNNGIICSSVENFHEVIIPDNTSVWFEFNSMCGVYFWKDEDCIEEFEWWCDDFLIKYQYKWLIENKGAKYDFDVDNL